MNKKIRNISYYIFALLCAFTFFSSAKAALLTKSCEYNNDIYKNIYGTLTISYYDDNTYKARLSIAGELKINKNDYQYLKDECPKEVYITTTKDENPQPEAVVFTKETMSQTYTFSGEKKSESIKPSGNTTINNDGVDCDSLFGDKDDQEAPAYWMQFILNIMKYAAIVALLAFVTLDFFKAIVADDKDALKKALNKAIKRFIYCIMLFFLPNIVALLMELIGAYGTCGLG